MRHFSYDGITDDDDENIDVKTFDVELANDLSLGAWSGAWSGDWAIGVRMADFVEGQNGDDEVDFDGYGLTLGTDVSRPLSENFGVYVKARTSIIFGDDSGDFVDEDDEHDRTLFIHEIGAGLQYDFSGFRGCDGSIRVGYETQIWSGPADEDSEDAGLDGLGVRVALSF